MGREETQSGRQEGEVMSSRPSIRKEKLKEWSRIERQLKKKLQRRSKENGRKTDERDS